MIVVVAFSLSAHQTSFATDGDATNGSTSNSETALGCSIFHYYEQCKSLTTIVAPKGLCPALTEYLKDQWVKTFIAGQRRKLTMMLKLRTISGNDWWLANQRINLHDKPLDLRDFLTRYQETLDDLPDSVRISLNAIEDARSFQAQFDKILDGTNFAGNRLQVGDNAMQAKLEIWPQQDGDSTTLVFETEGYRVNDEGRRVPHACPSQRTLSQIEAQGFLAALAFTVVTEYHRCN